MKFNGILNRVKWVVSVLMAFLMATEGAAAEESIKVFRIGVLGGENASDRLRSNECLKIKA